MESKAKTREVGAEVEAQLASMRNDIAGLADLVSQLMTKMTAETSDLAKEGLEEAARVGREAASRAKSTAQHATASLEQVIEDKPFASVLIALVIGFLAGSILRR
jgi:ElaB/YqjD/DUF883 family membrane-anchored ribosome-binding protein